MVCGDKEQYSKSKVQKKEEKKNRFRCYEGKKHALVTSHIYHVLFVAIIEPSQISIKLNTNLKQSSTDLQKDKGRIRCLGGVSILCWLVTPNILIYFYNCNGLVYKMRNAYIHCLHTQLQLWDYVFKDVFVNFYIFGIPVLPANQFISQDICYGNC